MRILKILILITIIFSQILYSYNISGYIVDKNSGETIQGVNIFIKNSNMGTVSDLNGFFLISGIKEGKYIVTFSHIAYEKCEIDINIINSSIFLGKIELKPRVIQGEEIVVTARKEALISKETDISTYQIDPAILQELPQVNRDIFKMLRLSPSVTIADPISPQLYVRGSDPGENLVLLDEITIYNPKHFLSYEAIFNPYAIKDISFMVGGFDVEFGGRNSSILKITTRDGHKEKFMGEFSPSTNGVSGAIEFPLSHNTTAMISGRFTSDLITRFLMGSPNVLADYNLSILRKGEKSRFKFSSFYARDFMKWNIKHLLVYFPDEEENFNNFDESFKTSTTNFATGFQYSYLLSSGLILNLKTYYSSCFSENYSLLAVKTGEEEDEDLNVFVNMESKFNNKVSDITLKPSITVFTVFNQIIKAGLEAKFYNFFNKYLYFAGSYLSKKQTYNINSIYLQDKISTSFLSFVMGYRLTTIENKNFIPERRFSLILDLNPFNIKFSSGEYKQFLTTLNTTNEEFVQFLDYYVPIKNRKPIASYQNVLELEYEISKLSKISISAYYKNMNRLYRIIYKDVNNPFNDLYFENGKGKSYGIEFLYSINSKNIISWISYTYSRSFRQFPSINNGKEYIFDADQPHSLKLAAMLMPTESITYSLTMQISSGFPKTFTKHFYWYFSYDPVLNDFTLVPSYLTPEKNNIRFPPRVKLDVGVKKKLRKGFGYKLAKFLRAKGAVLNFSIKNLLFLYRNPYYYIYIPDYGYYAIGIEYFPSISAGYIIKF
ncbi:MAG: TonB-dependent receptor [Candidatus Marinimicrobia bacterium]|nr:TonB-dependent receptor [Candidatus Neomarinimicrobiota bacterium]